MPTLVLVDDEMKRLDREMTRWAQMAMADEMDLCQLGDLHRALKAALGEVEEALEPAIVAGAARGMTYVELASAAGYGSVTTIVKIMKEAGAARGTGSNQPGQRRKRAA